MAWIAKVKGAYSRDSEEALNNAQQIYGTLTALGWTVNAIAGVLGNIEVESGYNPWRWQADLVGVSTGSPWTNKGYGLVQYTPAGKYINNSKTLTGYGPNFSDKTGSPSDAYAQLHYLNYAEGYYSTNAYPLSYSDFKASTESPAYLASAFLYNYERPADPESTEARRREAANYWYQILSGETPPPDPGPGPIVGNKSRKLPIWMYATKRR